MQEHIAGAKAMLADKQATRVSISGVLGHSHASGKCPVCAHGLSEEDTASILADLDASVNAVKQDVTMASLKLLQKRSATSALAESVATYGRVLTHISTAREMHVRRLDTLPTEASDVNTLEAATQITLAEEARTTLSRAQHLVDAAVIPDIPAEEVHNVLAMAEEELVDTSAQITARDRALVVIAGLRDTAAEYTSIVTRLDAAKKRMADAAAKLDATLERSHTLSEEAFAVINGVGGPDATTEASLEEALVRMKRIRESYVAAASSVKAMSTTHESAIARTAEIQKRIDANKTTLMLMDDLEALGSGFKPSGITYAYIDYKFRQIAEVTQEYLAAMEANFMVMVSDEHALAYDFVRLDDPTGTIMFQSKLSGGQKVRLSIAFLMAVHATIIPDVGFLMLDEPSMHLDEEGVLQLQEMLTKLGTTYDATGAQALICDHNPVIETACASKIMV